MPEQPDPSGPVIGQASVSPDFDALCWFDLPSACVPVGTHHHRHDV